MATSVFEGGRALYGAAIFISQIKELRMSVTGCNFTGNQASIDEGAMYLGDLNSYQVTVSQSLFKDNSAGRDGGNILAKRHVHMAPVNLRLRRLEVSEWRLPSQVHHG